MKNPRTLALWTAALMTAAVVFLSAYSLAQEGTPAAVAQPADASLRELDSQVRELRAVIEQMRTENAESRAEMQELRKELQDTRKLLAPLAASTNAASAESASAESAPPVSRNTSDTAATADLGTRVQKLEESAQLLGSKIDEQYQTKVETAAKYRARLSGIVLMNAFRNVGASDNLDLPDYAQPPAAGAYSQTSFGATLRQTEIGLEIFGPTVGGREEFRQRAVRFCRRLPRHQQRRQLWHGAHADRQRAARLAAHLGDCGAGFPVHFAAFSYVLCVTRHSVLCLRGKPVGLDASASRRTSLRSFRPTDGDGARWNSRQSRLGTSRQPVLAHGASRRKLGPAGLCNAHRMVPTGI